MELFLTIMLAAVLGGGFGFLYAKIFHIQIRRLCVSQNQKDLSNIEKIPKRIFFKNSLSFSCFRYVILTILLFFLLIIIKVNNLIFIGFFIGVFYFIMFKKTGIL
jgi:hypothetical protein